MRSISLFLVGLLAVLSARAATFTIDPAQSTVTLSGSISTPFGTVTFREQAAGSLTTRLEGSMDIETTATHITVSGGTVDARTNGVWQPAPGGGAGSGAADFGAMGTSAFFGNILGALRNIELNVTSPAQPLDGNQFSAAALTFAFPAQSTAALDYNAGIVGTGSRLLGGVSTNQATTTGTITGTTGSRSVSIIVDATFRFSVLTDNDTTLRVQGQIVSREGDIDPNPQGPLFSDIEVVNSEVRLTADGTTATARLQSSTNLTNWSDKQAQVTTVDPDTRLFVVPVTGPKEFYRVAQ